jgi:transglutaminase-like putative cysteine protease
MFAAIDPSLPAPADDSGYVLRLRHYTRFDYHGPVEDSFNDVRLCPLSDSLQSCQMFSLRLDPATAIYTYRDFYLNRVDHFELPFRHEWLAVEAESRVATRPDPRGPVTGAYPPERLGDPSVTENYFDFLDASHFVPLDPPVWREAIDVLSHEVTDFWMDAVSLGRHICRTFTYTPNATHAGTRVSEVLETRRGVCQDYAHVMLAMCRSLGIPARYVSGYFFNEDRAPDEIEASHAWVEVFLPGYGWKGFDPTHDRPADTRYVRLATGRDYGDIRPINGTYRGRGTRLLTVEVKISRDPS